VAFDAGDVTVGFSLGQLRARVSLPSYRVTKHPITREEFDACVDAGACMAAQSFACTDDAMKQLDGFTFDAKSAPAVCAGLS
jgi:formylglycine-generating enzyme required for sulfatase activity